jgi:hypothetical protein
MAATVVDGSLSASHWLKNKPDDYQGGKDLESALKSYETLSKKKINIAVLPTMPTSTSIKEFTDCAKELKASSDEITKTIVPHYTALKDAATTVASAASKTSGDLSKLAKDKKGDDKKKYDNAASIASAISAQATGVVGKLK